MPALAGVPYRLLRSIMSKQSREKHSRPTFEPTDVATHDEQDDMCAECGFFQKKANRDICEECAGMEYKATP